MTKMKVFLAAICLTISACNPRDPQQLSNDQKVSNYCHKPENKSLAACVELAKTSSSKPFISAGTEMVVSAYMIERQSEAFRYLQAALDIASGKVLVDDQKCLSVLINPNTNQTQVIIDLDGCPVSTESDVVTVSGQYSYLVKQMDKTAVSVSLQTTNLTSTYKTKNATITVSEIILFDADFHGSSALITRYDVDSKATIVRPGSSDEIVDTSFHGLGRADINGGDYSSYVKKWVLNYTSYFKDKTDKSSFSFKLYNQTGIANKEAIVNGCTNREQIYSADFAISFKSLAFENAVVNVKGRDMQLKVPNPSIQAKSSGFGTCSDKPNLSVLRTQINWQSFLPL